MYFDGIKEIAISNGLVVKCVDESHDDWGMVLSSVNDYDVEYDLTSLDYYALYFGSFYEYSQQSLIFYANGKPVAIWPLAIMYSSNGVELRSNGTEILPPLMISNIAEKISKKVVSTSHNILLEIQNKERPLNVKFRYNMQKSGCSLWYKSLLEKYELIDITHHLYVDLTKELEDIKGGFRKSFRPLVTKGLRNWNVDIYDSACLDIFEKFRLLHIEVSGRETRPKSTWDCQYQAILAGKGFLITLKDDTGELVGCGFFMINHHQGFYAVGAYRRDLFDQPLGHVVQYKAIEYMKSKGINSYYIGYRPYQQDLTNPTEKEIQIGYFKEGFATNMYPAFIFGRNKELTSKIK